MTDHAFSVVVDLDCFRPEQLDPELAAELRDPSVAARWRQALISHKLKLQSSIARARADKPANWADRRAKAVYGLGRVDQRLAEAQQGILQQRQHAYSSKVLLDRAEALLRALAPEDPHVRQWLADRAS